MGRNATARFCVSKSRQKKGKIFISLIEKIKKKKGAHKNKK